MLHWVDSRLVCRLGNRWGPLLPPDTKEGICTAHQVFIYRYSRGRCLISDEKHRRSKIISRDPGSNGDARVLSLKKRCCAALAHPAGFFTWGGFVCVCLGCLAMHSRCAPMLAAPLTDALHLFRCWLVSRDCASPEHSGTDWLRTAGLGRVSCLKVRAMSSSGEGC